MSDRIFTNEEKEKAIESILKIRNFCADKLKDPNLSIDDRFNYLSLSGNVELYHAINIILSTIDNEDIKKSSEKTINEYNKLWKNIAKCENEEEN